MPFQSIASFNFPSFGLEPLFFRGRSLAQPGENSFDFDVYNLVFEDLLDNLGGDILSWCYYINWHVRTTVTDATNANLSTFRGRRLRRNLGIIQFGTTDGTSDDDVIRYNNQSHRHFSFLISNRFARQTISVPTALLVQTRQVNLLAVPGVPVTPTSFFNLQIPNGSISALPHADVFSIQMTANVDIIYTVHYTGAMIQITDAVLDFDGYV